MTFYITVDGQFRVPFNPNNPPAIITNRGAVEEWKIENRSPEVHEFHMHQIHFLVQDVNGVKIPPDQQQFYDTFQVPYYKGKGRRFPYIRVKMDFRGAVVGDFVYHCHIPRPRGRRHDGDHPCAAEGALRRITPLRSSMTVLRGFFFAALLALLAPGHALAADGGVVPAAETGSVVLPPPDIAAKDGILHVHFNYLTSVDDKGRTLFCFVTDRGVQSPTLHVNPGDRIVMTVTNMVPQAPGGGEVASGSADVCGNPTMTLTSVNVHFHGTNTSPTCHSDEVIRTLINSGETFRYVINIPKDEPPGMYWYHPHVHGISSVAVTGGASGAIIVEGHRGDPAGGRGPAPAHPRHPRPQRRQLRPVIGTSHPIVEPFWDISTNYVPVEYPVEKPAVIKMHAGQSEFWRVVNASANTVLDLQLKFDGVQQPLQVVAFDGVPTGSQDGKKQGTIITESDILIPPAGRAEFIAPAPTATVKNAQFSTETIDSGPLGDSLPFPPARHDRDHPGPARPSGDRGTQGARPIPSASPISTR